MTFQAYLDAIKAKTGLGPEDFRRLASEKGLLSDAVKPAQIVEWLADDYGLGKGHAMAIVATLRPTRLVDKAAGEPVDEYFSGARAGWREAYDELLANVQEFGPVSTAATNSYVSLLKGRSKFAIVSATRDRLDVGLKLPGVEPTPRFEPAGSWNAMVTHRVRVTDPVHIDTQLINWLRDAYERA